MIGQPSQGITHRQLADVLEQKYVVEKRSPQQQAVTAELKDYRESKGGVEPILGLTGSKTTRDIQCRCKAEETIEQISSVLQSVIISNRCEKKESRWEQIAGPWKKSPWMN